MIEIEPFTSLFFIFQNGCHACQEAEPELDRFMNANPRVMALKLNADGPFPAKIGIRVKATPTYVLRIGQDGFVHVGGLTAAQIEKWISKVKGEEAA